MTIKWHRLRRAGANGGTKIVRVGVSSFDLAQIDSLVRPGFYANRADFVRAAIHAQVAAHADIATTILSAQARSAALRQQDKSIMHKRLLDLLRCPECGGQFSLSELPEQPVPPREVGPGLLTCVNQHVFPVVGGIPRVYPGAVHDFADELGKNAVAPPAMRSGNARQTTESKRTQQSFAREWAHHRLGDPTWYIDTAFRVGASFLHPLRIPPEELATKTVLDAGCGNGSQSVAYADHTAEVIAIDLSSGVELGQALLEQQPKARVDHVHFIQADLHNTPLAPASVDIIHAHGVLHHTPDSYASLRGLVPLLRPAGMCYVWLYSEGFVTPLVRLLRRATTRMPLAVLDRLSRLLAPFVVLAVSLMNMSRLRSLPPMTRRAATLTLLDVFGPPYMHHHTVAEVMGWFKQLGFTEVWSCLHSRRGFAVCGQLPAQPRPRRD